MSTVLLERAGGARTHGFSVRDALKSVTAYSAILAWTTLVNVPTFKREDADDGFFVEVARLWAHGQIPYVHAFDVKAPGGFAVLAFASALFGPSLATMKLVAILASAITTAILTSLVAQRDRTAAVLVALLYPVLSLISGDVIYQILNVALVGAFAIAISDRPARARAIGAGLAVGMACAIKQTSALDLFVMGFALARPGDGQRPSIADFGIYFLAAALPPLAFFSYFVIEGAAGPFFHDVVWIALHRDSDVTLWEALYNVLLYTLPLCVLMIVVALALVDRRKIEAKVPLAALIVWIAVETLSVIVQRVTYRTYFVPMLPPLLWIASAYISRLYPRGDSRRASGLGGFVTATILGACIGHGWAMATKLTKIDLPFMMEIKSRLSALGLTSEDRVFTLNNSALLNAYIGAAPPTPVFHPGHLYCDFPGAGLPALKAVFEARPRFIVYVFPNRRPSCETPEYAATVEAELQRGFVSVETGHAGETDYAIYRRAN